MHSEDTKKIAVKHKRKLRVRRRVKLHAYGKPRLSICRSLKHISAQIIDDLNGVTLASASSKGMKLEGITKKEIAKKIGLILAENALKKDIKEVAFDRGSLKFHGAVAEFANAAREAGLQF